MNLSEKFIHKLHEKIGKRKDLVSYLVDTLFIERDSANRRLNMTVQFTIREVEILCQDLNISLDDLMQSKKESFSPIFGMETKLYSISMEDYINSVESATMLLENIVSKPSKAGIAFSSLPLEFTFNFPYLNKFILYKWGYFYVDNKEYSSFLEWVIPKKMKEANHKLIEILIKFENLLYIWNPVTIFSTVKEIQFFKALQVINDSDVERIKIELHNMLNHLEGIAKGQYRNINQNQKIELYISNINHNLDFYFYLTGEDTYTFFSNYFITSKLYTNKEEHGNAIFKWIKSIKKISVLISESGEIERRLFFKEQHEQIDVL